LIDAQYGAGIEQPECSGGCAADIAHLSGGLSSILLKDDWQARLRTRDGRKSNEQENGAAHSDIL